MAGTLPDGLTVRAATMDDAEATNDLLAACAITEFGIAYNTVDDLPQTGHREEARQETRQPSIVSIP